MYHQIHSIDIKGLKATLGNLKFLEKCFVTAAICKTEVIIAAILQFYRTAYHIISSALPTMREESASKGKYKLARYKVVVSTNVVVSCHTASQNNAESFIVVSDCR